MMTRKHRTVSIVTVLALLATVTLAAASDVPYECTTNGAGNWEVLASGPISIPCPTVAGGDCSEIQYTVNPLKGRQPDHVAVLADHELTVVPATSRYASPACDGDGVTNIGIRDCSTQAVRMNKDSDTGYFDLIVEGSAAAVGKSIVVKKGTVIEECRIVSLAPSTCNPKAQLATKESFQFEDCTVEIELDPCTGEPGPATITGPCEVDSAPIGTLSLSINGGTPQVVTVGDGWISSGENSCSTKLFNGTSYTTCTCTATSDCSVKKADGTYFCPESKYSLCAPYQ